MTKVILKAMFAMTLAEITFVNGLQLVDDQKFSSEQARRINGIFYKYFGESDTTKILKEAAKYKVGKNRLSAVQQSLKVLQVLAGIVPVTDLQTSDLLSIMQSGQLSISIFALAYEIITEGENAIQIELSENTEQE